MPYIAIKSYPKDEKTIKEVTERINQVFQEVWGCKASAITISQETIDPANWEKDVMEDLVLKNKDKCLILSGEKTERMK